MFLVGQNLAVGLRDWASVLQSWRSEINNFKYGQPDRMYFGDVSRFTQMVWANSAKLGCAVTRCTNLRGWGLLYACNYAPAWVADICLLRGCVWLGELIAGYFRGNIQWWLPFEDRNQEGIVSSCASCPRTCNEEGLCGTSYDSCLYSSHTLNYLINWLPSFRYSDCGGKVCENGGTLNLNTCECLCSKSHFTNDTCSRK